ncbi:hypothetical protein AAFF_G00090060 [Aldrovandia affinis]|uniref:Uncharacterized protein n=1 Tax=Aldrovandia affinis TaxID=143900 RepID=A0AAD7WBU8_9TELE|nr:hypothetical protein AAFF_G00090060 [Aldrovandia affinis]
MRRPVFKEIIFVSAEDRGSNRGPANALRMTSKSQDGNSEGRGALEASYKEVATWRSTVSVMAAKYVSCKDQITPSGQPEVVVLARDTPLCVNTLVASGAPQRQPGVPNCAMCLCQQVAVKLEL